MIEITQEIKEVCQQIADAYRRQLVADGAVATGELADSLDNIQTEMDGSVFSLYFLLPYYWKYAPENSYPNTPNTEGKFPSKEMVRSLEKWIDAKNLDLNAYAVGKKILAEGWDRQPRKNLEQTLSSSEVENLISILEDLIISQIIDKELELEDL